MLNIFGGGPGDDDDDDWWCDSGDDGVGGSCAGDVGKCGSGDGLYSWWCGVMVVVVW